MDEGEEVETCLVKLLTLVEHCPLVYNEPPRQTPPPMSLGARQVIADKINVPIKRLVRTQTQAG